jgi:hypothetical protein
MGSVRLYVIPRARTPYTGQSGQRKTARNALLNSAASKGKVLSIGYGLATASRAAAQLVLTGELEQDRRERLTFWRVSA